MELRILRTCGPNIRRGQIVHWSKTAWTQIAQGLGLRKDELAAPTEWGESYLEKKRKEIK